MGDDTLARHVAHLFARDPLGIFGDRIELDDQRDIDHWENLQSTNWQSLRWKPPPLQKGMLDSSDENHIGWRVEFRSMEVQLTDFENAAFVAFVVLLSRVILDLQLQFYIPISKLEENMKKAHRREACTQEKFWFRTNLSGGDDQSSTDEPYDLLTVHEILKGKGNFPGLISVCEQYLRTSDCENQVRDVLRKYLEFIFLRAAGDLMTPASWMRQFVASHPYYQHDSQIPESVAHDLMSVAAAIGEGRTHCAELLGKFAQETAPNSPVSTGSTGSIEHAPSTPESSSLVEVDSTIDAFPTLRPHCYGITSQFDQAVAKAN